MGRTKIISSVLIFDDMYVYQTTDNTSKRFYGHAADKNEPATIVLTLMIKSFGGKYRDIVGTFPVSELTVELFESFVSCLP